MIATHRIVRIAALTAACALACDPSAGSPPPSPPRTPLASATIAPPGSPSDAAAASDTSTDAAASATASKPTPRPPPPRPVGTELVVSGEAMINALAVDATHVYFGTLGAGFGEVVRVEKTGGSRTALASAYSLYNLRVSSTHVYFDSQGGAGKGWFVERVLKGGGARERCAEYQPGSDGDDWEADDRGVVVRTGLTLLRYPQACKGAPALTKLAGKRATSLRIDATHAFVVVDDALWAAPRAGGAPKTIAAPIHVIPTLGDDSVYWVGDADDHGVLMRVAKTGGRTSVVSTVALGTMGMAVDAASVYWVASDEHALHRVTRANGASVSLGALGERARGDIAIDATHVYWIDDDGAAIRRAPK